MLTDEQKLEQRRLLQEGDDLYDRYVRPLEADHWGEFVAVSREGRVLLGSDVREVGRQARDAFGPGNFVFRVGPRVTGRWL